MCPIEVYTPGAREPVVIEEDKRFKCTLPGPGQQRVELKSTDYGFRIYGDDSMAGYETGRFDKGNTLQLADGVLAKATSTLTK